MKAKEKKTIFKPFSTTGKGNQFLEKTSNKDDIDYEAEIRSIKLKCIDKIRNILKPLAKDGKTILKLKTGSLCVRCLTNKVESYIAPFVALRLYFDEKNCVFDIEVSDKDVYGKTSPMRTILPISSLEAMDIARTYNVVKEQIETPQVDINEQFLHGFYKTKDNNNKTTMHCLEGNYYFADFKKVFENLSEAFPEISKKELHEMAMKKAIKMYKEEQKEKK